jgi:peptidoglycan/xylan/chitin deacetylase (PgdA/CDA1 family)
MSGPRSGQPTTSVAPAPKPTATTGNPVPRPTSAHPSPSSTAATGTVTAAALGIAGAGSLKIPAWPKQPGMRWRGPDGSQGSTGTTSVALTFDDGPGPYTSQVLDLLDEYHVKATFCMIGRQIHAYQAVVRRMIADGMTLCNHSWDHDEKLGKHSAPSIAQNLQRTIDAIHKVSASATMAYFRNPGGNFTPGTVRVCELLGMRPLYWSEDTDDWTRPGVPAIEKTLLTRTHRDSIVLMHDGGGDRSETVTALRALLHNLSQRYHLIALPTARTVTVSPGKTPPPRPTPRPATADVPAAATEPSGPHSPRQQ